MSKAIQKTLLLLAIGLASTACQTSSEASNNQRIRQSSKQNSNCDVCIRLCEVGNGSKTNQKELNACKNKCLQKCKK